MTTQLINYLSSMVCDLCLSIHLACTLWIWSNLSYLGLSPQPQNILLTSAIPLGDIRIVDFGLSRRMDSVTEVREILGTPEYVGESCILASAVSLYQ